MRQFFKTRKRLRQIMIALAAAFAVTIAVLTLMPAPDQLPGSDKFYHVLAFAALTTPIILARVANAFWVGVVATIYGGMIELIQPYFSRTASWGDLGADAIGAFLGVGIGLALWRLLKIRKAGPKNDPLGAP